MRIKEDYTKNTVQHESGADLLMEYFNLAREYEDQLKTYENIITNELDNKIKIIEAELKYRLFNNAHK